MTSKLTVAALATFFFVAASAAQPTRNPEGLPTSTT